MKTNIEPGSDTNALYFKNYENVNKKVIGKIMNENYQDLSFERIMKSYHA